MWYKSRAFDLEAILTENPHVYRDIKLGAFRMRLGHSSSWFLWVDGGLTQLYGE